MKVAMLIPDNRDEFKDYSNPNPRFGPAPTALLEGFAQIPDCEIHVVCCLHRPLPAPEKLADNIWYHAVIVPKWGWRLAYLGCVWTLRRKLHALRPDVVHGQGTERYCALSAALSGFPNLITLHGNMRAVSQALQAKLFSFHRFAAFLEPITLRLTDGVICLSNYTKREVGALAHRTWILPNAVDSTFFTVPRHPPVIPTIFCAGTVDPRKNQHRLIMALDELAARIPIRLMFAGRHSIPDTYAAKFLRLCADRPWCHYEGSLDVTKFQEALGGATVLVLPSLEDNCPMVILEAMAAGVPVAASAIGGIPDLIENGVSGVLFDPSNEASIRSGIELLLCNTGAAQRIADVALQRAHVRFSPAAVARRHLEIYRELLSSAS